jgi:hypothetical protein
MEPKIPPQNLIKQVEPYIPMRRASAWQPWLMDVLAVASALSVSYVYKRFLDGTLDYSWLIAAATVFAVLSILQVLFTRSLRHRAGVVLFEVVALLGMFYKDDPRFLGIAGALSFLFLFWGDAMGHAELEETLEISFFRVARPPLKKITTALLLFFIVIYLPQLNDTNTFISEANFQMLYNWGANYIAGFYPEVNFSTSFGKFSEGIARMELKNSPAFQNLSPTEEESAVQQTGTDLVKSVGKSFDMTLTGNELASDVIYNLILKLLNNWRIRAGSLFAFGWAIVVFLILRGLGVIFYLFVGVVSFLVYQVLLASNFVHIIGETRTHEVIEY